MNVGYEYENEESINEHLICSICQRPFDNPCSGSCDHTYCRQCIQQWIENGNASCPICRKVVSTRNLKRVEGRIQNMLGRLRVRCIACGQTCLKRSDFDNHIQEVCPRTIISCPSENNNCLWRGQRDQIILHLIDCRFLPMRLIITQILTENEQLSEQVNLLTNQTTEQKNNNRQLREQVNHLKNQTTDQKNENRQLHEQIAQLNEQVDICQREHQIVRPMRSIFRRILPRSCVHGGYIYE